MFGIYYIMHLTFTVHSNMIFLRIVTHILIELTIGDFIEGYDIVCFLTRVLK